MQVDSQDSHGVRQGGRTERQCSRCSGSWGGEPKAARGPRECAAFLQLAFLPCQNFREPGPTYGKPNPPPSKAFLHSCSVHTRSSTFSLGDPLHTSAHRGLPQTLQVTKTPFATQNRLAPGAAAPQGQGLPCLSNKDTHARNVQKPRHQKRQLQGCHTPGDTHEHTKRSLRHGCSSCWT